MSEDIYIGTGKEKEFANGGSVIKFAFSLKDLETMQSNMNAAGWVNVDIFRRKTPGTKGQTHYGKLNTWKPPAEERADNPPPMLTKQAEAEATQATDDLPF